MQRLKKAQRARFYVANMLRTFFPGPVVNDIASYVEAYAMQTITYKEFRAARNAMRDQTHPSNYPDMTILHDWTWREFVGSTMHREVEHSASMIEVYAQICSWGWDKNLSKRLRACQRDPVRNDLIGDDFTRAFVAETYAKREWSALPILADYLVDRLGFRDDAVSILHLRDGRAHGIGCWALEELV